MDPSSFYPMSMFWGSTWFTSYYFYVYGSSSTPYYVGSLHLFAWILQLIGHKVFEKNRPAFTESLVQAFVTAPLFVYYEIRDLLVV